MLPVVGEVAIYLETFRFCFQMQYNIYMIQLLWNKYIHVITMYKSTVIDHIIRFSFQMQYNIYTSAAMKQIHILSLLL